MPSPFRRGLGEGLTFDTLYLSLINVLGPHPRPFSQREKGDDGFYSCFAKCLNTDESRF
jgi:hypothetical protein